MKIRAMHSWEVSVAEAVEIQRSLASKVSRENMIDNPRKIAGVDISGEYGNGLATAAVVVLSYPELEVMEQSVATLKVNFPYVPGLLSFRELPLVLAACEGLTVTPDLFLADAHGLAHPRHLGLASHLGLILDIPTIGCAKSVLCGRHDELGENRSDHVPLCEGEEVIGAAVRTKRSVKPMYVSIGHKVDLDTAIHWTIACCLGYRLPEPTRLAHLAASGKPPQPHCSKRPIPRLTM